MLYDVRILNVSIAVPWRTVYDFIRAPENLPKWASGLASGVHQEGADCFVDSPMGRVKLRMTAENPYGVLDHEVTLPSGQVVYNALRALPNKDGCELCFTVFRTEGVSDEDFARDAAHVARDLQSIKQLLEGQQAPASSPARR